MNTNISEELIALATVPVAQLDSNLCFINYSPTWLIHFNISDTNIIGKYYFDVFSDTPIEINELLTLCLQGQENTNLKGKKFTLPSGRTQWLKWKMYPCKNDAGEVDSISVILEDFTKKKQRINLATRAEKVANIGGWHADLLDNTVYWTRRAKQIHEVPYEFVPTLNECIDFYKIGEHRSRINKAINTAINTGNPWDEEAILVTAEGKEIWVRVKGEAETHNGKTVKLYGTFQDIDDKKKIELKYRAVAKRLELSTKAAKIGTWEYNILDKTDTWDSNMYSIYEVNELEDQVLYDVWKEKIHPDDFKKVDDEMQLAIKNGKNVTSEFRIQTGHNTIKFLKSVATVVKNQEGVPSQVVGVNWDITEQRLAQQKLEKSRESFKYAFEHSAIGMALVGLDGKWLEINQSVCNSLGYSKAELLKLTFQDITHPNDLEKDIELLEEVIKGNRISYQIDKRYFHKRGGIVHALLTVTAVKNYDGTVSHFISQIVDLTSRVYQENKLRSLVDVTRKQNESLYNFAHIVSHNLRSHSSNLSMLKDFLDKEKDEKEKENLMNMLGSSVNSLSETVAHLNEVVQITTDVKVKMRRISLLEAINTVQKNINVNIAEQNANVILNIDGTHFVHVVPAYLDSILLNLFTNALKYSFPNRTPVLEISSKNVGGRIILAFKDNGLGIDLDTHGPKMFGMYKTFHAHKDAKGIGLFITKNQMMSMGGKIHVESEVNVGTTFTLSFNSN
ncbi:PAS domain S-box-containing protein [Saonia flava]|uniref:histidine kinase n=1 Tax=Saonia flava TaxID=523696 RepID=A0A846QXA2_9FLAO|nr:PAS domain S-box protein [Saonia flava]NJB71232.1 PAS domain S-box-containing protein [Saonia flava]